MVYVDDMQAGFDRMKMCHMIADTDDELHAMADRIGVARKWHQKPGTAKSHYDIALSKRALAVAAGAVEITWRQTGRMVRRRQVTGELGDAATAIEWQEPRHQVRAAIQEIGSGWSRVIGCDIDHHAGVLRIEDADYIAVANPTAILALLAERDVLAAQAEASLVNAQKVTEKYDASRLHFHTHFGPSSPLHRFLDTAGGEGYVLGGVDAGDLFVALYGYPEATGKSNGGS